MFGFFKCRSNLIHQVSNSIFFPNSYATPMSYFPNGQIELQRQATKVCQPLPPHFLHCIQTEDNRSKVVGITYTIKSIVFIKESIWIKIMEKAQITSFIKVIQKVFQMDDCSMDHYYSTLQYSIDTG